MGNGECKSTILWLWEIATTEWPLSRNDGVLSKQKAESQEQIRGFGDYDVAKNPDKYGVSTVPFNYSAKQVPRNNVL